VEAEPVRQKIPGNLRRRHRLGDAERRPEPWRRYEERHGGVVRRAAAVLTTFSRGVPTTLPETLGVEGVTERRLYREAAA
jgi:hypothetical protein